MQEEIFRELGYFKCIEGQMRSIEKIDKSSDITGRGVKRFFEGVSEISDVYDMHKRDCLPHFEKVAQSDLQYKELCNMYRFLAGRVDWVWRANFDAGLKSKKPAFMDHVYIY